MDRVRVGIVSRTATYWPLLIALRDGAFADAGVDVEILELGSTSAGVTALLEDRIDVAATCPDVLIGAIDGGADLTIAGGLVDRPPASVVARSDLVTVASLAGRRVAVTELHGSVSRFLRAALAKAGLAEDGYERVVLGPTPQQAAALREGRVDAAMLTFPFDAALVEDGFARVLAVGDALRPCAFTTLNIRRDDAARIASFRTVLASAIDRLADVDERVAALRAFAPDSLADADRAVVDFLPAATYAKGASADVAGIVRLLEIMGGRRQTPEDAKRYLGAA